MAKLQEIYGVEQTPFFFKKLYDARKKIYAEVVGHVSENDKIIDIGTTPVLEKHENFFLHHFSQNQNITCLSNQNLDNLKSIFPNIKTILGDGRDTKLPDNSYDVSISNATLEHVGNFEDQRKFINELYRISKKKVIITTPNRYYPIDTHTMLPLIHWLPKKIHRKILKILNYNFLAEEKNLNLLSTKDLKKLCKISNFNNYKVNQIKFFGFKSNLILIINKN